MSPSRHRRTPGSALRVRRSLGEGGSKRSASNGFTIIEVMMAAAILVVGFMGMIQAITIGSEMLATARRQTLANQIITHEIEQLRLKDWTTVITVLPASTATLNTAWNSATSYYISDTVTYGGVWYRCKQAGSAHAPSSSSAYWSVDTPPFANAMDTSGVALGTTFSLTRTVAKIDTDSDGATDLVEVTFTIQWTKSGTTTAAAATTGSWLNQLTFFSPSPISRTYTRSMTAYFGKYGLNLNILRS